MKLSAIYKIDFVRILTDSMLGRVFSQEKKKIDRWWMAPECRLRSFPGDKP
jgi:hypothetical protein